jgi:hypothetical protein
VKAAALQWKSHYAPGEPTPAIGASPIPFTAGPPMIDRAASLEDLEADYAIDAEEREATAAFFDDAAGPSIAPDIMATLKAGLHR